MTADVPTVFFTTNFMNSFFFNYYEFCIEKFLPFFSGKFNNTFDETSKEITSTLFNDILGDKFCGISSL